MNWLKSKLLAYKGEHPTSRKIFVLGSGRSGTHWVGYILDAHPGVKVTIEKREIFKPVKAMAVDFSTRAKLMPKLICRYRWEHMKAAPLHYADKSHPNMWLTEELSEAFPNARFIGIEREPYGMIASMLVHGGTGGTKKWHEQWEQYPIPNPFIGITEENLERYKACSLVGRCAMRWVSSVARMTEIREVLGDRMIFFHYEDLIADTEARLGELTEFLELTTPLPLPEVKRKSLDKWRDQLTDEQLAEIKEVTGMDPPA